MTKELVGILRGLKKAHGWYWKSELRDMWMTGNYCATLSYDDKAKLQYFRNSNGSFDKLEKVRI